MTTAPRTAQTARVHIIGRSGGFSRFVHACLIQKGYEVSGGRTEAEALRRMREGSMDALIYCVPQQGQRILCFLDQLVSQQSDTCVILVGPDSGAEQVARFLRNGVFDYLTFPLAQERLVDSVRQGLEIRRAFIEVRDLSGQLTHVNRELEHERDNLRRWNRNLTLLNQLSQRIAGSLDADEIGRVLGAGLRPLVDFEIAGLVWLRSERIWLHSSSAMNAAACDRTRRHLLARTKRLAESVGGAAAGSLHDGIERKVSARTCVIEQPLVIRNAVHGFLYLEQRAGCAFESFEAQIITSVATSLALALHNADSYQQAQHLAMRDSLTNLPNRRALNDALDRELRESQRYLSPACLVMVDLDHFKTINDRFGHLAGDDILRAVGAVMAGMVRSVDVVARYGGEEFAIVLPRTGLESALVLANRIRERLEQHSFVIDGTCIKLTVSMGVACVPAADVRTAEAWVADADAALYQAKTQGRNCVQTSSTALFSVEGKMPVLAGM